ncbi:MAG: hypothetical protein E6Q48_05875 [Limnohabitans sp.]|nr:MAG: hypothetical protein E6Q48_05875 [Limnohabitans sp.]
MSAKEDLDLTTLIPTNPATATSTTTGSQIIVNDLNMTDASAQAVTISLNDVLQLGSTNAFDKSGNYSGDLQMRVSGAANDTVRLYSSDGWKLLANTVVQLHDDPSNAAITHGYRVYTDSTGRVDLFIQEQITQVNFL